MMEVWRQQMESKEGPSSQKERYLRGQVYLVSYCSLVGDSLLMLKL
jgi:hypothetical protein